MIDTYVFIFASVLSLIAFFFGARMGYKHGFSIGCYITITKVAHGLDMKPEGLVRQLAKLEGLT